MSYRISDTAISHQCRDCSDSIAATIGRGTRNVSQALNRLTTQANKLGWDTTGTHWRCPKHNTNR